MGRHLLKKRPFTDLGSKSCRKKQRKVGRKGDRNEAETVSSKPGLKAMMVIG